MPIIPKDSQEVQESKAQCSHMIGDGILKQRWRWHCVGKDWHSGQQAPAIIQSENKKRHE